MIKRGSIHWVDFAGGRGAEIRKARPSLIVSEDDHNVVMATVTVLPLSSPAPGGVPRFEVAIPAGIVGDGRPCRAKPHQIRAVDKSRVGRRIGALPTPLMTAVESALLKHLGLAN